MRKIALGLLCAAACAALGEKKSVVVEPTGPRVAIDTTMGRVTCKLYSKQAPKTVARFTALAEGTLDWTDGATNTTVHGKPFYDGVKINGASGGFASGDRVGKSKGVSGPAVAMEKTGLKFDQDGLLIMSGAPPAPDAKKNAPLMESSSMFYVLDHANTEYDSRGDVVFGRCDAASLPVVTAISHVLLSVENDPKTPVAINHIAVVRDGQPMPAVAADVAPESVVPPLTPPFEAKQPSPEPTGPTALIETTKGTMSCRLFNETPVGTANFIALATGTKDWKMPSGEKMRHGKRFYDGLTFARVIPDFMIQNADMPGQKDDDGDLGFHFDIEAVPGLTFDRPGRLAYANAGPNTNESEFFITEHPMHRLDEHYTIFGQCDDAAVKIVEAIARVPRDKDNRPLTPVVIKTVTIVPKS